MQLSRLIHFSPRTLERARPHRMLTAGLCMVALGVLLVPLAFHSRHVQANTSCSAGKSLSVVAHEDDDLIFMNPDLMANSQGDYCLRTVYLTAGDANIGAAYWRGREFGSMAAYAQMEGVENSWTENTETVLGHPISTFTLDANPRVSLMFMHLPDGNPHGTGYLDTDNEGLRKLWQQKIPEIHTVDGATSYTHAQLVETLAAIMDTYRPNVVRTQDFAGHFADGDHSDHHAVGYFTRAASAAYGTPHELIGYMGYPSAKKPQNISGTLALNKQQIFFAYAPHDPSACQSASACKETGYGRWLVRQYRVADQQVHDSQANLTQDGLNMPPVLPADVSSK